MQLQILDIGFYIPPPHYYFAQNSHYTTGWETEETGFSAQQTFFWLFGPPSLLLEY